MATMTASSDVCSKEGNNHAHNDCAALHDNNDSDLIYDPLLKYLHHESSSNTNNSDSSATKPSDDSSPKLKPKASFNIHETISNIQTRGYHVIPSILLNDECNIVMEQLWEFVSDVSGGVICRDDPSSWFDSEDVLSFVDGVATTTSLVMSNDANGKGCTANNSNSTNDIDDEEDTDPWPYTDSNNSSNDRFQSLGAGILLSHIHEILACRVFTPLFGNETELLCSKEGFMFTRPLIVEHSLNEEEEGECDGSSKSCHHLVWKKQQRGGKRKNDGSDGNEVVKEGQQYYYAQGVPPRAVVNRNNSSNRSNSTTSTNTSKKQYNKQQKLRNKQQCYKDITGLCHIQASVSFTDQTIDQDNNGGYFLCFPYSHSNVHRELLGGRSQRSPLSSNANSTFSTVNDAQIPLTNDDIVKLKEVYGCKEERIYAKKGDVILWRSDLVHAEVAPSLIKTTRHHDDDGHDNDDDGNRCGGDNIVNYKGSREFRAVAYCSMLPVEAVKEYNLYSIPKHKVQKRKKQQQQQQQQQQSSTACTDDIEKEMMDIKYKELMDQKLEGYRCGKTGDHRPELEVWYPHRRVTMWNAHLSGDSCSGANIYDDVRMIPPRLLQRPKFRLGAPKLTVRQAELYGLLPYQKQSAVRDDNVHCNKEQEKARRDKIERAVSRGVRFVEGVYKTKDMEAVGPCTVRDGKFTDEWGLDTTSYNFIRKQIPICQANMEVLTPCTENGIPVGLSGQDKYLGGMASPCGRYIYGVPGHAKRVIQVDVNTRKVEMIGPEYHGEFKWLRGVEIPADDMGQNENGSYAYPSGCCLALPCNSYEGCVLKVDPATASVSTFITDPIPNGAETGWLYHGGSLAGGYVYAIPASASRVMKIDPRLETTTYIGPAFDGIKAKWYGGLLMADGCIYGIPHNATGVLKIDPRTDEVSVLAEGTLPEGRWKWHGGLASLDGKKFIGFPNNEDSILVFDVEKQKVYTVGDSTVLRSGYHRVPQDGGYKYLGGSLTLDGKFAYLFPCDAEYVLKFDMETDECKLVGPHLTEGENKFQNGFVGRDGCIYGCPQRGSGVLRIIPPGVARCDKNGSALPDDEEYVDVMYCGDDMVGCKDKMEGGVLGMDGTIFNIPLRAKAFVNILPGPSTSI